ncbi:MAG: CocE/NonD family hydrolase [Synechococcaceae cyanobacterium SM2_3_1]|nr:CocE/NonD family hydrolase [Synechococcaceae cyanobacterium SM2_3_1]
MQTRDGVRLDADVYAPDAAGSFPVLLMRQPYGRSIASTVVYAHPRWYAAQGYIVVIQDVRGRGTSEGAFYPFASEVADGEDSVYWAAGLPGSNGGVGMYGFSYQGATQLYAASTRPAPLKAICPAMLPYHLHEMVYEGGAFCLQSKLSWALQLSAETARLRQDQAMHQKLVAASRQLPLTSAIPSRPDWLEAYPPASFYFDWLDHPDPDANYWKALSPSSYLQDLDLPMLHIGGWHDSYLRGTLALYRAMVDQCQQPQRLLIGPWPHLPWGRRLGAIDYGPEAVSPVDRLQVRWFDQLLKGIDTGILQEAPVQLFEMGRNHWQCFPAWPWTTSRTYFLKGSGLAGVSESEGQLITTTPERCPPDVFVHDPWRPVPSLGGNMAIPAGSGDRSHLDCRTDVLTYTTDPLPTFLKLLGSCELLLYCSADAPSFDISAVLSEVRPEGIFNLTQAYARVNQTTPTPLRLQFQSTSIQIPTGHALRLSLSAAAFPAYALNPGTGAGAATTRLIEARPITITVQTGGQTPSQLLLPLLPAQTDAPGGF